MPSIQADKRYFPHGVAKVFYTAHHAVEPAKSAVYLALLRAAQEGRQLPPPILYHNRFYQDDVVAAPPVTWRWFPVSG